VVADAFLQEKYVHVDIGGEGYAVNIQEISEIIRMQEITEVPNSDAHIRGVINLRGRIVPVVSLHRRLAIPSVPASKMTRIVIVGFRDEVVGVVVDQVHKVISFSDIGPPPDRMEGMDKRYIAGIGQSEGGLVSILRMDRILSA